MVNFVLKTSLITYAIYTVTYFNRIFLLIPPSHNNWTIYKKKYCHNNIDLFHFSIQHLFLFSIITLINTTFITLNSIYSILHL